MLTENDVRKETYAMSMYFQPNQPIKLELNKPVSENIPADNASPNKGSIISLNAKAGLKRPKKFNGIPYEKLITIAELLR